MNIEITLREGCNVELIKSFVKFIIEEGLTKKYFQGAFSTHGFGMLEWFDMKKYFFDFKKQNAGDQWFKFLACQLSKEELNYYDLLIENIKLPETIKRNVLTVEALFSIKNTLIIGSPNFDSNSHLDKSHLLNEKEEPIISAKSVRGALRHRGLKILKTIDVPNAQTEIENLFGSVDKKEKISKKGRLYSYDAEIVKYKNKQHNQNRIKICRLTGKVIDGALMTEEVINGGEFNLVFTVENYNTKDLFLLMQCLKDLIQEDVPIGGNKTIGRGVITGQSLWIRDNENEIKWQRGLNVVSYSHQWKTSLTSNPFIINES